MPVTVARMGRRCHGRWKHECELITWQMGVFINARSLLCSFKTKFEGVVGAIYISREMSTARE